MSLMHVVQSLTKPLISDRALPPGPGTPPDRFEALYAARPDPWGVLTSPIAQQRYLAIIEVVAQHCPCGSILDVGWGEGALTRYLVGCANDVVGIDPSPSAVSRAQRLVPHAAFLPSLIEDFESPRTYDVVLAVEVLYYVKDVRLAIEKMLTLGRTLIVSYTHRERERLEPHLAPYCVPESLAVHRFFGLERFGFTVMRLTT